MAVTKTQAKAFLPGATDVQLTKIGEYLDAVSPKTDGNGDPRPNTLNDFSDHVREHYAALYKAWKKSQGPEPEF